MSTEDGPQELEQFVTVMHVHLYNKQWQTSSGDRSGRKQGVCADQREHGHNRGEAIGKPGAKTQRTLGTRRWSPGPGVNENKLNHNNRLAISGSTSAEAAATRRGCDCSPPSSLYCQWRLCGYTWYSMILCRNRLGGSEMKRVIV